MAQGLRPTNSGYDYSYAPCRHCEFPEDIASHQQSYEECNEIMKTDGRTCEAPADHHVFEPFPLVWLTLRELNESLKQ